MTAKQKREQAVVVFNRYINNPQFKNKFTKTAIQKELIGVDKILRKELSYDKDLRNVEYLQDWFLERQYYKKLVSLFK